MSEALNSKSATTGRPMEESASLDFKSKFEVSQAGDWCELVKDIVAMANSGGGEIVIGLNDDGTFSGYVAAEFLAIDAADLTNKIHKYTEEQFSDFRVFQDAVDGHAVAVLKIGGVRFPIVFSAPGEYDFAGGKAPKTAFRKGTTYFRHGPKSEPGNSADLRASLERELERIKEFWLEGITKVVHAPPDSRISVVQSSVSLSQPSGDAQQIRLTNSGDGPEFKVVDNDQLYPYRVTELVKRLDVVLGPKVASRYDIGQVRKLHGVDLNPNFSHKGKFASRQYSEAFVEWISVEYSKDNEFFAKVRDACRRASDGKISHV